MILSRLSRVFPYLSPASLDSQKKTAKFPKAWLWRRPEGSPLCPDLEAVGLQALGDGQEGGIFSLHQGPLAAFNTGRSRVRWLHTQESQGFQAVAKSQARGRQWSPSEAPRRSSPAHTLILGSQICESGSFYCLWLWVTAAPQNKHQEPILASSTWWQYGCRCSRHHFQASEEGKQG